MRWFVPDRYIVRHTGGVLALCVQSLLQLVPVLSFQPGQANRFASVFNSSDGSLISIFLEIACLGEKLR